MRASEPHDAENPHQLMGTVVTAAQVARWAKTTNKNFNTRTPTPTACKNVLCAKFGKNNIKAVARTKSGSFMVATPPGVHGKCFCFPK